MSLKPLTAAFSLANLFACFLITERHQAQSPVADNGSPLILTSLIEAGQLDKARTLSRVVSLKEGVCVESYSGFFKVSKEYDSNLFFWYFPPENKNSSAPVLLWLQGGPGASSLFGLFVEHGPYFLNDKGELERRRYHWALTHHLIYVDNPVGTGFSYTQDSRGYAENQTDVSRDLYSALVQFFKLFPHLQDNEFYVAGESYAGKYVPAIGYLIHENNPTADLKINLKGVAIGNGLTDPENMMVYGDYFYQLGLIDHVARQRFKREEARVVEHIRKQEWGQAATALTDLVGEGATTLFGRVTGLTHLYNYLRASGQPDDGRGYEEFLARDHVRAALHVHGRHFQSGAAAAAYLAEDLCRSARPWLERLLEAGHRVLVYSGQLDLACPHPAAMAYIQRLQWAGAAEHQAAKLYPWNCGGQHAGVAKEGGGLTVVMVKGAGHLVPADQPQRALQLITRFTAGAEVFSS